MLQTARGGRAVTPVVRCCARYQRLAVERGHSARDNVPPAADALPEDMQAIVPSEVVCMTRLGGLLKKYARRAE